MSLIEPDIAPPELSTSEPKSAHIVKAKKGSSAQATVMEARVMGTPVEALCGHRWVPQHNPENYPVCQQCVEIYDMYRGMDEELPETPKA